MAAQFAGRLSLIAFAIVEARGVLVGGDFSAATKAALLTASAFFVLGLIAGELARRVVEESADREFEIFLREQQAADGEAATDGTN